MSPHEGGNWEPRLAFSDDKGAWVAYDSSRSGNFNLQLAHVSQDQKKKKLTYMLVGLGLVLFLGIVGGAFGIKSMMDKQAAERAIYEKQLADQKAQMDKLQGQLKEQNDAVAQLESAVSNAKDEAAKKEAEAKLAAARAQQQKTQSAIATMRNNPPATGGGTKPATPRPACTCAAGDPLCSCIQ